MAAKDAKPLLRQAGILDEVLHETTGRVRGEQFATLYRLIAAKLDDELPNLLIRPLRGGAMKFALLSIINAPTMGVAMHRYSRILRLTVHDFEVKLIQGTEVSRLVIVEPAEGRQCKTMAIEMILKVFHGLASWLIGREIPLLRVDFDFDAPLYAQDFRNLFPGPVFFNQGASQLVLDSRQLKLRIQRNQQDVRQFLARDPCDWLCASFKDVLVTHQVREHLLQPGGGSASIDDIARQLKMSTRTLCRKLDAEHTCFKQVKDALRRDLAIDKLNNSDLPMTRIAQELGFEEVSSFHRAFRAWTGTTPGTYRQGKDN